MIVDPKENQKPKCRAHVERNNFWSKHAGTAVVHGLVPYPRKGYQKSLGQGCESTQGRCIWGRLVMLYGYVN